MIKFRQKEFVLPLLAGSGMGLMALGTGVSVVQGHKGNKIAKQQGEEAAAEQARANREMEKIARQQAADQKRALKQIARQNQNPTIVPMMDTVNTINNQPPVSSALDYPQQNSYSNTSILSNLSQKSFARINMQKLGQTSYDIIKGIRNTKSRIAGDSGILTGNWLRSGLAMGAGMTGINYLVDKGIQIDRKKSGMPELEQKEITDKERRKKNRNLILTGVGAATAIGGGIAAKRGILGTGWKNWANNNLTKQNLINKAKAEPKKMGKAIKEHALSLGSLGFGAAFAIPTITSYISEKKAYKDQIKDQRNYSEDDNNKNNRGSGGLLKKAAIGTALAAGTIAAGRRGYLDFRGGGSIQKATNNLIARTGKVFKNQKLKDIGTRGWAEGAAKEKARIDVYKNADNIKKAGGDKIGFFEKRKQAIEQYKNKPNIVSKYEQNYKDRVLSRESKALYGIKHPLRSILSGVDKITRFDLNGGEKSANQLVNNIRKQGKASGNEGTQKVVDFLDKHKTLAVAGSVGVGTLLFKPFNWGDKLVRGTTKAVDKNSFAYENRNQEEVN